MVYNNTLTAYQKDKKIPLLIERDGNVCIYDLELFIETIPGMRRTIDHLNDNPQDNKVENLALCHFICNQKKKTNFGMKLIALTKLRENISLIAESLGEGVGARAGQKH